MTTNHALDWLISVDDHVIEPPNLWQDRIPKAYLDDAPKVMRDGDDEWWQYQGKKVPTPGLSAMAGRDKKEFSPLPAKFDDMRPGCYDSRARLADMDEAGILASLCFPSFPRFCGQVFTEGADKKLGLLCVQAYNDWMIEEWCGTAPGRFIPMIILPLWDPKLAAEEILRCAGRGAKAITFTENPVRLGLPGIHDVGRWWDPVWAACAETDLVVCMHIGSSSTNYGPSDVAPQVVKYITSAPVGIAGAFVEWLFSPQLQKYDNLRVALSEGSIGWIPFYLERCEYTVTNHRAWVSSFRKDGYSGSYYAPPDDGVPDLETFDVRETFRKHIFGCFIDDPHGMRSAREIGLSNIMIETDYPHSDSPWPHCIDHAHKQLEIGSFTDAEKYAILRGNAERVFNFTPAAIPTLSKKG